MKVTHHFALLALCSTLLTACGSDEPDAEAGADTLATPAAAEAEGAVLESADYIGLEDGNIEFHLHWVGGLVAKDAPPGSEPPALESVRTAAGSTFDRVMFRFAGTALPGYEVTWATEPPQSCAGRPAPPEGARHLRVRMRPVSGTSDVRPQVEEGHANLKGLAQTCAENGEFDWHLAMADSSQVRVLELRSPPRLVVDVRNPPRRVPAP